MFSLKDHARRNIRLAAVGAAATMGVMAAGANAALLQWDPGHTPGTPSGGTVTGTFSNVPADANFSNGATDQAPATNDDVHFGVVGGTVNVPAGTVGAYNALNPGEGVQVNTLTFDVGGYSINVGPVVAGPFGGVGADGSAATLAVSNAAGNNTINSDLYLGSGNNTGNYSAIDVGAGTLTTGNVVSGYYNRLAKTGSGTLVVNGVYSNARPGDAAYLTVRGGTMLINGVASNLNGAQGTAEIHVLSGARLGGGGTVRYSGGAANNFDILNGGILSPATNGTSGKFSLTGGQYSRSFDAHLRAGSHFEIDLVSPDSGPTDFSGVHDVFSLTAGDYGGATYGGSSGLDVENGVLVDINGGTGSLTPGTYHIVRLFKAVNPLQGGTVQHTVDLTNNGFVPGNVPAGYSYQFVTVPSSGQNNAGFDGIDLIVTASAVPEPASIGLLGMGTGLMLLRRRKARN